MKRNPNTKCCICNKKIYRRPNEIEKGNVYCSRTCHGKSQRKIKTCRVCNKEFLGDKPTSKYCSRICANVGRTGIKYLGKILSNESQRRLSKLKEAFNFSNCMISGCGYNKTFDIHRYIPGKDGGKYEIGNMFAICPQHHAEITRSIIQVEKVNDCLLVIKRSLP